MEEDYLSAPYFRLIYTQLSQITDDRWVDEGRINLLKMDANMLEMFFHCLKKRNHFTIAGADEEIAEQLRSMITDLKLIWPKDFTLFTLLLQQMGECKTRPTYMCIEDFNSLMFELESKILQSKPHVDRWYKYSTRSVMLQLCKTSNFVNIINFIRLIREDLILLSRHRAGNIDFLKKQMDILSAKILFVERNLFLLNRSGSDRSTRILQYLDFAGIYVYRVACLTCLYWAKQDYDDETADEMNVVLFDMLQKFIPYAYDITPLCCVIGVLDVEMSPSKEEVESFVNFFFEHLAIVLKDDYPILQDRLMLLFTFLINHPSEHTEGEGDLIRSQIYATLHEDVYLVLSFDEMKEAFSDEKALLSGCLITIDIANAMIRQLHLTSSS